MDKFEYMVVQHVIPMTFVCKEDFPELQEVGRSGWEAYSVVKIDNFITVWLKRRIVDFKYAIPIRHPGPQPPVPWPAAQGLEENANQTPGV